jgi:hypothetical protein
MMMMLIIMTMMQKKEKSNFMRTEFATPKIPVISFLICG